MNKLIQKITLLLLTQLSIVVLAKNQTIEVVNSSDATLTLEHGVPEYSKTFIELKKIDPLQYQLNRGILNDSPEEIRAAIEAGANIHQPRVGKAPLLIAVSLKRFRAVETLLDCGATVVTEYDLDASLLDYSIKLGDFKSAFFLLKKLFSGRDDRYLAHKAGLFTRCLQESIKQNDPASALYLLKNSKDFFGKDEWVTNKRTSKKEWILKDSINMELIFTSFFTMKDKQLPIKIQIFSDIVQDLIDHGYEADKIWSDRTIQNLFYNSPEIMELFIKNGANPNFKIELPKHSQDTQREFTYPIFEALNIGNKGVVEVLVDNGAYLDQVSFHRCGQCHGEKTPLAIAINHGYADIVELLISNDAKL